MFHSYSLLLMYTHTYMSKESIVCDISAVLQEFETNGSHDLDKARTCGSLKAKLKFPDQGEYALVAE